MATRRTAALAERDLVRVCHGGLDLAALRDRVLRSLRRIMPVDAAFFATCDPETLLFTGAYAEEPLAGATHLFLDNEYGHEDVNKFAALATSGAHVSSLDAATRGDRPSSDRSRTIMSPLGLGDELRAALTAGRDCWGYLCLHRTDHPLGFTSSEAALVGRIAPHIAHALRLTVLRAGRPPVAGPTGTPAPDAGRRPGVVLLTDDLDVVATTPEAEELLGPLELAPRLPLPVAVYGVAARLRAVEHGARALPSTRVLSPTGQWLEVHASRLEGAGAAGVAVVVEPCGPRSAVPILLSAHGLSRREAEVARLVLRGASTRAIADALHISANTVQDHLKAVFDKLDVRSRRDLVGLLLGG